MKTWSHNYYLGHSQKNDSQPITMTIIYRCLVIISNSKRTLHHREWWVDDRGHLKWRHLPPLTNDKEKAKHSIETKYFKGFPVLQIKMVLIYVQYTHGVKLVYGAKGQWKALYLARSTLQTFIGITM